MDKRHGKVKRLDGKVVHLLLTGTARTEEESSLVVDADLPSNLLPAGEKVSAIKKE